MHTCMADLPAFLRREKGSLQYLRDRAANIRNLQDLYLSAYDALIRFKEDMGMSVILRWPVIYGSDSGRVLWLYVGGLIESCSGVTNVSYFLCVAEDASNGNRKRVLRKYHFDFADPTGKRRRPDLLPENWSSQNESPPGRLGFPDRRAEPCGRAGFRRSRSLGC